MPGMAFSEANQEVNKSADCGPASMLAVWAAALSAIRDVADRRMNMQRTRIPLAAHDSVLCHRRIS